MSADLAAAVPRAGRRAPIVELRRRMSLLAALGVTATALMAGVGTGALALTVRADDHAHSLDHLASLVLQVDELVEAQRADAYVRASSVVPDDPDVRSDSLSLHRLAATLPDLDGVSDPVAMRTVADRLAEYADLVRSVTSAPKGSVSQASLVQVATDATTLAHALDEEHTAVEADKAAQQALRAREQTLAVAVFVGLAVVTAFVLWLVARVSRRTVLASLARVSDVARRVADGDLTARVGSDDRGDLGDLARVIDTMAGSLQTAFETQAGETGRQEFSARLDRALEHADDEEELVQVLGRAMSVADPSRPGELLVADSSEAHLRSRSASPTAGAPGCSVGSPWSCPAVRGGVTLVQTSSDELDACPKLHGRGEPLAAVCIPVSFMGRAIGVLHSTGPAGVAPSAEVLDRLHAVAGRAGNRLGTVRAFARAELQATTDGLTGLVNRRALEERIRGFAATGRRYAVLMADVDHFKQLNDTFGHETGDRALRVLADAMRSAVGADSVVARYGGEEFVIAVPEVDAAAGLLVAEGVQAALAAALATQNLPTFTVSIGVSDSEGAPTLVGQLRIADAALLAAKRAGRNRCLLGDPEGSPVEPGLPQARVIRPRR